MRPAFSGLVRVSVDWAVNAAAATLVAIDKHRDKAVEELAARHTKQATWYRRATTREEALASVNIFDLHMTKIRYGELRDQCTAIIKAAAYTEDATLWLTVDLVATLQTWTNT